MSMMFFVWLHHGLICHCIDVAIDELQITAFSYLFFTQDKKKPYHSQYFYNAIWVNPVNDFQFDFTFRNNLDSVNYIRTWTTISSFWVYMNEVLEWYCHTNWYLLKISCFCEYYVLIAELFYMRDCLYTQYA